MPSDVRRRIIERQRKPRTCLMCDRMFASSWPGERTCPVCAYEIERVRTSIALFASKGAQNEVA